MLMTKFNFLKTPTIDFANNDAGLLSVERFVDGCSVELAKWALEAITARMNANEFGNRRKGFIIGRSFFRSPRSLEFCSSVFFFSFRWRLRYWITRWRIYQGCFLVERKDLVDGRLLSNVKASFDHQFAICQLSKLMKSIKCHTIAPIRARAQRMVRVRTSATKNYHSRKKRALVPRLSRSSISNQDTDVGNKWKW